MLGPLGMLINLGISLVLALGGSLYNAVTEHRRTVEHHLPGPSDAAGVPCPRWRLDSCGEYCDGPPATEPPAVVEPATIGADDMIAPGETGP
jgi:hypothetical protein